MAQYNHASMLYSKEVNYALRGVAARPVDANFSAKISNTEKVLIFVHPCWKRFEGSPPSDKQLRQDLALQDVLKQAAERKIPVVLALPVRGFNSRQGFISDDSYTSFINSQLRGDVFFYPTNDENGYTYSRFPPDRHNHRQDLKKYLQSGLRGKSVYITGGAIDACLADFGSEHLTKCKPVLLRRAAYSCGIERLEDGREITLEETGWHRPSFEIDLRNLAARLPSLKNISDDFMTGILDRNRSERQAR